MRELARNHGDHGNLEFRENDLRKSSSELSAKDTLDLISAWFHSQASIRIMFCSDTFAIYLHTNIAALNEEGEKIYFSATYEEDRLGEATINLKDCVFHLWNGQELPATLDDTANLYSAVLTITRKDGSYVHLAICKNPAPAQYSN